MVEIREKGDKMSNVFEILDNVNVKEHIEKKGNYNYLSWAWAVRTLLEHFPEATWIVHEYEGDGYASQPYMQTPAGAFVKVTLTVNGISRTQVHPVFDNRNKTVEEPNAMQINNSIMRCLAKAIALHGLGLYIYAGEDLPKEPDTLTKKQYENIMDIVKQLDDKVLEETIVSEIGTNGINEDNYIGSLNKLKRKLAAKKPKNGKAKA